MSDDRREDWHRGVDENLASLNAGQRIWEREQKSLRKLLTDTEGLLRGDIGKETDGLIARLHKLENEINLLKAIVIKDQAGNGGLVEQVRLLKEAREDRRSGWGNVTKILVAMITSGALGLFWHDIQAYLMRKSNEPLEQLIEKAKRPKGKTHYVVRVRKEPETDPTED